jgi:hypothetical protein
MPLECAAVGLARADREPAGQLAPGRITDDQVADGEVAGAADDLLRLAGRPHPADVDEAEPDRLLEPVSSSISSTRPTTRGR